MLTKPMATKRPTRADVAKRAGVAPSTVTLILNNHGTALGIKEETRKRVTEAAQELGYYPNRLIRAMKSGRTGIIGLYLRSDQWGVTMGYWATMRGRLEEAVSAVDSQLLVHCAPEDCSTEEAFARQAGGVVDGVIILNSGADPIAQRMVDTGMLAVEIGDSFSSLPHVAVDGGSGIDQMVEYLKAKGYKRPVFVSFPSPYELSNSQRRNAFLESTKRLYGKEGPTCEVPFYDHALAALKGFDTMPDAVVCTSDEMAFGVYRACLDAGLRVPEDLAITGFDCLESLAPEVVLTSVETPLGELARAGVGKLLDLINGRPVDVSTVLPVGIREGQTT